VVDFSERTEFVTVEVELDLVAQTQDLVTLAAGLEGGEFSRGDVDGTLQVDTLQLFGLGGDEVVLLFACVHASKTAVQTVVIFSAELAEDILVLSGGSHGVLVGVGVTLLFRSVVAVSALVTWLIVGLIVLLVVVVIVLSLHGSITEVAATLLAGVVEPAVASGEFPAMGAVTTGGFHLLTG
jgi:hypothetical protein